MMEFPHKNMDKRPRKRPRLTWDMPPLVPPPPKVTHIYVHIYSYTNSYVSIYLYECQLSLFLFVPYPCSHRYYLFRIRGRIIIISRNSLSRVAYLSLSLCVSVDFFEIWMRYVVLRFNLTACVYAEQTF